MISKQAKEIKKNLFLNMNHDYYLNTDISVQRSDWEDSVADAKLPEGTNIEVISDRTVKGELVSSQHSDKQHIILYFHGGGFTQGSSVTHRKLASYIVYITNIPVLVHDYPLAPEHPYPEALDYSEQVYFWLIEKGYQAEQIIFGGDSSGCALALSLILKLKSREQLLPKGIFLFSPMLDLTLAGETMKTLKEADPCVFIEDLRMSVDHYCKGESQDHPFINPLYGNYDGFPDLFIQVGSSEILLDDAVRLKDKAKSAKVSVSLEIWDEMWHVFQGWIGEVPEAEQALERVSLFLKKILDN